MDRRGFGALCVLVVAGCSVGDGGDGGTDLNQPPGQARVDITPTSPTTEDDLVATVTEDAVDPDGNFDSYRFEWEDQQGPLGEFAGLDTLPATHTRKGQQYAVLVTPVDTSGEEGPVTVVTRMVVNTPPQITAVLASSPVYSDVDIEVEVEVTDADGDPTTVFASWSRDGAAVPLFGTDQIGGF